MTTTQWHIIVAWGKTAHLIDQILSKGDEVVLSGKIVYRSYEKENETKFLTEIHIDEFHKSSGKKEGE